METFEALPDLTATAGHIRNVQATLDRLNAVRDESWAQLLTSTARLYRAGALDLEDLAVLSDEMKENYGAGYSKLWAAVMPIAVPKLKGRVRGMVRNRPNGPHGTWVGTFPIGDGAAPVIGTSVVYVLFDDRNEPVYVGSTLTFRVRMAEHRKTKGRLSRWIAYPCRDREHAYEMEVDLLRQHKPRMNRKVGR